MTTDKIIRGKSERKSDGKKASDIFAVSWERYKIEEAKETPKSTPQKTLEELVKRPPKSILKTTVSLQKLELVGNDSCLSPAEELPQKTEFSAFLALAKEIFSGDQRSKKIETYIRLSVFLRSYETISDKLPLFQYIPELVRCIKRDAVQNQSRDIGDYQMASSAFKVLGYLLSQQEISDVFNLTDAKFFIEYSVSVLESPSLTKTSATMHLWFLSIQKLPSAIITPDIADRIISACLKITLSSITISQERLSVLIRIMNQCPQIFIRRASEWVPILHISLIDTSRPIRENALQCAFEIEKVMHDESKIGLAIIDNMKEKFKGKLMIDIFSTRFEEILKEDGNGVFVAQSWSVLVTIMGTLILSRWNKLNVWLKIIQLCFNHNDISTKIAAQMAWVRLIYVFTLSSKTQSIPLKRLSLLSQPMQLVLGSKSTVSSPVKKTAIKTICALFYSILRPGISMKDITTIWENVIFPLFKKMIESSQHDALSGCKIIASLFDVEKIKPWKDDRLMDNSYVEPSEIPRIEPKWIRNNISITRSAIEAILVSTAVSKDSKLLVWRNFNKSINFVSNKEIKITFEAMDAVSKLKSIENELDEHVNLFAQLVFISFEIIGYMYFMNKSCIIENEDLISTQVTGSKNSSCQLNLYTPMAFLFRLFLNPFPRALVNKTYIKAIFDVISNIGLLQSKDSEKIDLLVECLSAFDCTKDHNLQIQIWKLFPEITKKFFFEPTHSLHVSFVDLEDTIKQRNSIFKILEWGNRLKIESIIGVTGAGYKIIEPLAESFLQESPEINKNIYNICTIITKKVKFPSFDNISMINLSESNLKIAKTLKKTISYENFNMLISNLLVFSYKHNPDKSILSFIQSVSDYIKIIPIYEIMQSLQCIQGGLSLWILDEKEIVKKCSKAICYTIKELWSSVLSKLKSLDSYESSLLHSLSLLLESGFRSKNHIIVLSTVETWNKTFGKQTVLDYPSEIVRILELLSKTSKILLPSFPILLDNENLVTPFIQDSVVGSNNAIMENQEFSTLIDKSEVIENTTNQALDKTNIPSSLGKAQISKKIRIPIEPFTIVTRRMSAELAQSLQKKDSQNVLKPDSTKNIRQDKNNGISKNCISDDKYNNSADFSSLKKTRKTLEFNKDENFLPSIKKSISKNIKLKSNKTFENNSTKNQEHDSLKKRKHDSELINDSLLDDSPLLRRLRPRRSADNHPKTSPMSLEISKYTKSHHSNHIDTSSDDIPVVQSESTSLFTHLEQLLPQMEHIIPQMTHQSLLKLESILLHLQNTIWKTREKSIMSMH
ncbi:hypothetical protein PMAC_000918 [Pneumocystis sp. 'macacae']|nr:hypothetical protein PMAC_000918 [Pneumocystis sp. 'macacae']